MMTSATNCAFFADPTATVMFSHGRDVCLAAVNRIVASRVLLRVCDEISNSGNPLSQHPRRLAR
jgi:hypothetical protein